MKTDRDSPREKDRKAIDDAAEVWFGMRDGGLTAAQEVEFTAWLAADPRHRRAFARFTAGSRVFDRLAAFRPVGDPKPDPKLPLLRSLRSPVRRSIWLPVTLAAAAAVAIAYVGWWRPMRTTMAYAETVATEVGGLRKITLPDGSTVTLNTDSGLAISFTAAERRVRLRRGEAHFAVAKNPVRPFIVEANGIEVRAVGTAFNVRLHHEAVEVLVTEGSVRVDTATQVKPMVPAAPAVSSDADARPKYERVLATGEHVVISRTGAVAGASPWAVVAQVAAAEASRLLAWQQRRIEFDPTPLRDVVAEFNRYNHHKLVVVDAAIGGLTIGGAFPADDYETFVRLLESSFGIVADRREHETLLRRAP